MCEFYFLIIPLIVFFWGGGVNVTECRVFESHYHPISVPIWALSHVPCPCDLPGLCLCGLFPKLCHLRKILPKCLTVPLGLCTEAVDSTGSCCPLFPRTGGVTECPQGGSHCHQMGAILMSSHPQHSWCPGLLNLVPHGESRMPCRWTWIPGHLGSVPK